MSTLDKCKKLKRHPIGTFSNTIAMFGGLVEIPIRSTMFGWRKMESILTSFVISLSNSSVITGSNITFTATSLPRQIPFLMTLNPPYPSYSPSEISLKSISQTPEQEILPSEAEDDPIDIIELLEISALRSEISCKSLLLLVRSILSSS